MPGTKGPTNTLDRRRSGSPHSSGTDGGTKNYAETLVKRTSKNLRDPPPNDVLNIDNFQSQHDGLLDGVSNDNVLNGTSRSKVMGMSDDNQALFHVLADYIQQHVEERFETHMQEVHKSLQSLHVQTQNELQTQAKTKDENWRQSQMSADRARHVSMQLAPLSSIDSAGIVSAPIVESSASMRGSSTTTTASVQNVMSTDAVHTVNTTANLVNSLEEAANAAAEEKECAKLSRLRKDLLKTEKFEADRAAGGSEVKKNLALWAEDLTAHKKDTILDCIVAVIIIINSIVIGISMDYTSTTIDVLDIIFTGCFLFELMSKFYLHGIFRHFGLASNWVDFLIVSFDIIQLTMKWADSDALDAAPAASMFRVARLVRLVRLIRLARLQMLDDLVALISGMVGGMTTLLWSVLLFFLILYIVALLFREFFGKTDYVYDINKENLKVYFDSVPRCMFTVFRFFFGDFSTYSGLSIFEGIQEAHGSLAAVTVCLFFFMITIGLFNVIAAIFVESTLQAANHAQVVRKTERMNDDILWATRLTHLVRKVFEYNGNIVPCNMSEALDYMKGQAIPEAVFQRYMLDKSVIQALNDLEIDEADHKYLFDILDNDNTGSIFISQLSDGLERLRGDPRRSDIICVDLMVRSIQQQTDFLVHAAKANVKSSTGNRKKMEENRECLNRVEGLLRDIHAKVNSQYPEFVKTV